jgi:transcriptional regulator with XRE-family HTH domain
MKAGDKSQRERVIYDTRLDRFLHARGIDLEALAESAGFTRQNLGRYRSGQTRNPQLDTITRLVLALRKLLGEPVLASQLFYLGEAHDDDSPEARQFSGGSSGTPFLQHL